MRERRRRHVWVDRIQRNVKLAKMGEEINDEDVLSPKSC